MASQNVAAAAGRLSVRRHDQEVLSSAESHRPHAAITYWLIPSHYNRTRELGGTRYRRYEKVDDHLIVRATWPHSPGTKVMTLEAPAFAVLIGAQFWAAVVSISGRAKMYPDRWRPSMRQN